VGAARWRAEPALNIASNASLAWLASPLGLVGLTGGGNRLGVIFI
jgi:hypothetical protein